MALYSLYIRFKERMLSLEHGKGNLGIWGFICIFNKQNNIYHPRLHTSIKLGLHAVHTSHLAAPNQFV